MQDIWAKTLSCGEESAWDALLARSPQGNPFLRHETLHLLAANETPRATPRIVVAGRANEPPSAGWAVLVRRRAGVRYCSSFPLFYAGPVLDPSWLGDGETSNRLLLLERLARAMQEGLDVMETECAPGFPDSRGLIFAGCSIEQIYAHVWPACAPPDVPSLLNRGKRREMRAAAEKHTFGWVPMTGENLRRFDNLHNLTLEKFKWTAPAAWRRGLLENMRQLEAPGICRLFAAHQLTPPSGFCAAVSLLLDPGHDMCWLWRVAYEPGEPGLVSALYVHAAQAVKSEFGPAMQVNFGGSPRVSLALFKDFLGAVPTPHWRILWNRRGWKPFVYNFAAALKETIRRNARRLRG